MATVSDPPSGAAVGRPVRFDSVDAWLKWQEQLNPRGIELGLERCLPVAHALNLMPLPFPLITVGGTNGKGSCVAMLEAILSAAGHNVGAYTSPHLLRFNETIRIAGTAVSDDALIRAFETVADARGEVKLTWFEFRTLAAALILREAEPDVALLEVGLGGRLDAVNMFDADVALISSIGIDHVDWLGDTRDQIGREKAGIARRGRPVVCAEPAPPSGFIQALGEIGARLYLAGRDFGFFCGDDGWRWRGPGVQKTRLPRPGIPGACQYRNAAAVLMALELMKDRFDISEKALAEGIARCRLSGRQQIVADAPELWLDVAHNPEAAQALAAALGESPRVGRTRAVFAIYADKDIAGVAATLTSRVHHWHLAPLPPPRGASAEQVADALKTAAPGSIAFTHPDVAAALAAAREHSAPEDRIVVFGSFETVRRAAELESWQT